MKIQTSKKTHASIDIRKLWVGVPGPHFFVCEYSPKYNTGTEKANVGEEARVNLVAPQTLNFHYLHCIRVQPFQSYLEQHPELETSGLYFTVY